eukprot:s632_g8.t1
MAATKHSNKSRRYLQDYQVLCHGWLRGRNHVRAAVHWVSDGRTTSSTISRSPACTALGSVEETVIPSCPWLRTHSHEHTASRPLGQLSKVWSSVLYMDAAVGIFPGDVAGIAGIRLRWKPYSGFLLRSAQEGTEASGGPRPCAVEDFAILQDIIGPTPPPPPEPSRKITLVLRKIPVISLKYHRTRIGSLCYFASIGDAPSVKYLLEQARRGGDYFFVNSVDDEVCRRTALHYCAIEGNVEVAEALLQAGADERTPLHLAAAMGQVGVARQLLGTCLSRMREAMLQRFRAERLEPTDPWEDAWLPDF